MTDGRDSQADCDATRRGFLRVFWGFLLILLDIRFNRLDILPDPIGYVMIAGALGTILLLHPHFATARTLATIMILLSLGSVLEIKPGTGDLAYLHPALVLIALTEGIVNLFMVGYLCAGIAEAARAAGKHDLARIAEVRLKLYVFVLVPGFGLVLIIRSLMPQTLAPVMILFVVLAFIATCLVMGLMWKASDQQADLGGPPQADILTTRLS